MPPQLLAVPACLSPRGGPSSSSYPSLRTTGSLLVPLPHQSQLFAYKKSSGLFLPQELPVTSCPPVPPKGSLRSPALFPFFLGSSWWGGHGRELASGCKPHYEFSRIFLVHPYGGHLFALCSVRDETALSSGGLLSFWNSVHCVPP